VHGAVTTINWNIGMNLECRKHPTLLSSR